LSLTWLVKGPKLKPDLDRILALAERTVPGCDAGSVTLIVEGQPQTEAVIDRVVVAVDLAQYEMQEGPCLAAAPENRPIHVDLIPTDERFPRFAERVAHTGVQSSLSLPVVAFGGPVGCLDLYSWTPSSFDARSQDLGADLATQVGVAVAKSQLLAGSRDLAVVAQRLADEHADIAVANGMLMVLEQCTLEQAAALIRSAASSEAQTLVTIARRVIAGVASRRRAEQLQPAPPSDPNQPRGP
jgi:GAF domain-containing protein